MWQVATTAEASLGCEPGRSATRHPACRSATPSGSGAAWAVKRGPSARAIYHRRRRRSMGDDGHEGRSIDYDALPSCLAERAVEPGDRDCDDVRSTYVWPGSPGLVLRPSTPQQVAEALAFARRHDVPLAVRSGGHSINGRSTNDGGIVIDLRALSHVEVLDRERRLVWRSGAAATDDNAARREPPALPARDHRHRRQQIGTPASSTRAIGTPHPLPRVCTNGRADGSPRRH
jgi:hypothetical protein